MCNLGTAVEMKGYDKGFKQGTEKTRIQDIANLMENLKLTALQAMDALDIPKKEQETYRTMLLISSTVDITRDGAMQVFKTLRMQAEGNGITDMSLEDINEEIALTRNYIIADGETRLSSLIQKLLSLKRYDDIDKATSNTVDRERLYREFGIISESDEKGTGTVLDYEAKRILNKGRQEV